MKKHLILIALVLGFSFPLLAEMKKDPVTNKFYSIPASPDINQEEYNELLFRCYWMSDQIIMSLQSFKGSNDKMVKQVIAASADSFLRAVRTKTAFRLITDLQKLNS